MPVSIYNLLSRGDFGDINRRRHSMAGFTQLEKGMRELTVETQNPQATYEKINDYFDNSDHRTKAW